MCQEGGGMENRPYNSALDIATAKALLSHHPQLSR